jgi:hypothetical protein
MLTRRFAVNPRQAIMHPYGLRFRLMERLSVHRRASGRGSRTAELAELITAVNKIDRSLETPAITLLRVAA